MKDFPVFTTENGVASIVLREIPYRGEAYITLRDALQPDALLAECVDFCKIAGAEKVYARGHSLLEKYPLHTAVVKMQQLRENIPPTDAALFPVTDQTAEQWRGLYNERMQSVDNASTMTIDDMKKVLAQGAGYFVHKDAQLLGIGIAYGEKIEAVASCCPGAGEQVLLALCSALFSEKIVLEVATTNSRAISLYHRLGFLETEELSRWYVVENNLQVTRKNT